MEMTHMWEAMPALEVKHGAIFARSVIAVGTCTGFYASKKQMTC